MPLLMEWLEPRFNLTIQSGDVHVWVWEFDCPREILARYEELLSETERIRLQRFRFDKDRTWRTICHARRRIILARYLDIPPASIAFDKNSSGRPSLTGKAKSLALDFNLSHTEYVALMVVAVDLRVGADIEAIRPIYPEITGDHFPEMEHPTMTGLTAEERLSQFYKLWTQKEAILKAEGIGFRADLPTLDPEPQDQLAIGPPEFRLVPGLTQPWYLQSLHPAHGIIGAVATSQRPRHISYYRLID
jgi:4'-phosphopantetheinyl transferase